ncbi:hypothetical protein GUJ93_ZPchr0002g24267 [Zizania palustris]|uniref:Replication factor A C-terminal domain-containing protein n=1 Tax=Zizania palustris TaxID=103762 RepID=A0A8J5SQ02_ZIZPA|nr:hypothetical protein GUJ93_ZPchr0002g24267 [Zizania palustris]KAG8060667.1 hypothetical protein GUJ93_ZPchr0002g24267 [Zizania palustris]KAG8060668.1 hypothetical protein GUJ93_ZPchr0002g24267 [Zizania palustris]
MIIWAKSWIIFVLKPQNSLNTNDSVLLGESNATLKVSVWGERVNTFDGENIYNAGQTAPQIIIFVGTLVKNYTGIGLSLSGGSACKWYLNPTIPEAQDLKQSMGTRFQPIKWTDTSQHTVPPQDDYEQKTLSEILDMNPHKCKRTRFIVTITVRKICNEESWWYNSCGVCYRAARPYGDTYKCTSCNKIAMAAPRYKLMVIAGDDTKDTKFVLFGKIAQRILCRPVEKLIEQVPPNTDFIPDEITCLLERKFVWNVSFIENTVRTGIESLQVNNVVYEVIPREPLMLMSPTSSASASSMLASTSSLQLTSVPSQDKSSLPQEESIDKSHAPTMTAVTPKKQGVVVLEEGTPTSKLSSALHAQAEDNSTQGIKDMPLTKSASGKREIDDTYTQSKEVENSPPKDKNIGKKR